MIKGDNKEDRGKDKKDGEREVKILVFGVIVLGLALIGISILLKDPELHYIIRGLGISIIGGAIIAWAIGHLLSRAKFKKLFVDMQDLYKKIGETDKTINETVKETSELIITDMTEISKKIIATDKNINDINENIRISFKLIKESEDSGLLKIYEPFDTQYKKQLSTEFEDDIKDFLSKEKNEIKLYGISLRLFFNNLGKFRQQVKEAFKNMRDNKVNIKVLLISPYSDWTEQRRKAEEDFCDKIVGDLIGSIEWLDEKFGKYNEINNKIYDNIRFYKDAAPDFFLFITSECVIFEIYHTGISQLRRDIKTHEDVKDLGLGGHVPAFKFDNSSPMYKYLNAHFDYFFEKEIEGETNKYHDGTLPEMLERLRKEPVIKK